MDFTVLYYAGAQKEGRKQKKNFEKILEIYKKVLDMGISMCYIIKAAAPKGRRREYLEN